MLLLHQDIFRTNEVGHVTVLDVVVRRSQVIGFLELIAWRVWIRWVDGWVMVQQTVTEAFSQNVYHCLLHFAIPMHLLLCLLPAHDVVQMTLVDCGNPSVPAMIPVALLSIGLNNLFPEPDCRVDKKVL